MEMSRAGCCAGGNQPRCHGFPAVSTRRDAPRKGNSHGEGSEPSQELRSHGWSHPERHLDVARGEAEPPHGRGTATRRFPLCPRHNTGAGPAAAGRQAGLTPAMRPLWILRWFVRVELKPKATPTVLGKGAANRVSRSFSGFTDPQRCYCQVWLKLASRLQLLRREGKPCRHLFFLGYETKKVVRADSGSSDVHNPFPARALSYQNQKDV